jgi:hypothetical protein
MKYIDTVRFPDHLGVVKRRHRRAVDFGQPATYWECNFRRPRSITQFQTRIEKTDGAKVQWFLLATPMPDGRAPPHATGAAIRPSGCRNRKEPPARTARCAFVRTELRPRPQHGAPNRADGRRRARRRGARDRSRARIGSPWPCCRRPRTYTRSRSIRPWPPAYRRRWPSSPPISVGASPCTTATRSPWPPMSCARLRRRWPTCPSDIRCGWCCRICVGTSLGGTDPARAGPPA